MKKKKFGIGKAILIAVPILLIGGAAAVLIPLHRNFSKNAYVPAEIQEAPAEFVEYEIPEYPELSFEKPDDAISGEVIILPDEGLGIPGGTLPDDGPEALPMTVEGEDRPPETRAETERAPETDAETAAETKAETEAGKIDGAGTAAAEGAGTEAPAAPAEQAPGAEGQSGWNPGGQTVPAQTWTPAEALPSDVNTPVEYDSQASFANSSAVSVYGYTPIYKVAQRDPDVTNILVLGTDSRDVTMYRGNSDTMIVFSYNKKLGTVKMVTFMRDALVPIAGHDWNRLNSAYPYDGVGLTVNTINQLFGLDIQSFVIIDFNGTSDFINYIGGVDISLTAEEAAYYAELTGKHYTEGVNHLNASDTLIHMRNRKIGYDFARTSRQRDVLTAVLRKILSKPVTEIYDILNHSFSLVKTNIPLTTLSSLALSVATQGSGLSITSQQVPYSDAYQNAWYNGLEILSFDIGATAWRVQQYLYN